MFSKMIASFDAEIKKSKFQVVVDSINLNPEMRAQFIKKVKAYNTHTVCICFDFSKQFTLHINHIRLNHQKV